MSVNFKSLAIGACLLGAGLISSSSVLAQSASTSLDGIAAVIDEDVILRSELEQAVTNVKAQYANQTAQLPPDNVLERQVMERLIIQRLQIGRAKEIGIRVSDEDLNQAIKSIAGSNNMSTEQFQQRLAQEGIPLDEYRINLRDEIMQQRLRQSYVQSRVQISDAEVEQFVSSQKASGPEVQLANILVALPENPTEEQVITAKGKIDGVRDLIFKNEMTFKAAAIRYSDAQNALDGGDIGWRSFDSIPPQFAAMIANMQPGEMSQAIRGPSGYQIIQVVASREPQSTQVEEFKAQAILIDPTVVGGFEVAKQKADDILVRLKKGEDMAKLAKEFSTEDLNAAAGGVLDWFAQAQWGTEVGAQVVALKDGELSAVFQNDAGYMIIKRLGYRMQDANAEAKRRKARETIGQRKADEEFERFLRQLRAEAFVESRLVSP